MSEPGLEPCSPEGRETDATIELAALRAGEGQLLAHTAHTVEADGLAFRDLTRAAIFFLETGIDELEAQLRRRASFGDAATPVEPLVEAAVELGREREALRDLLADGDAGEGRLGLVEDLGWRGRDARQ